MKNLKKLFAASLVSLTILTVMPIGANAEWRQNNSGWWYSEGSSYSIGWKLVDGNWYYFDSNGYMRTGWTMIDKTWYYFYANGTMASNTNIDNIWALDGNGKLVPRSYNTTKLQLAEDESLNNYMGVTPGTESSNGESNGASNVQLKPDTKVSYEWYGESELKNEGISIDNSGFNIHSDIDESGTGIKILNTAQGTVKLINSNTKAVIKSIKFNDTLASKDIKDGYYEMAKDSLTIRIRTDDHKMEFSGEDLRSLGILK